MTPERAERAVDAAFGPGAWAEAGEYMTPEEHVQVDPELDAIRAIVRALSPLTKDERARILRWAVARYSVTIPRAWGDR